MSSKTPLKPKRAYLEIYKSWEITQSDYAPGYYEATNLNDCDALMKYGKSIEQIKAEIDD